MSEAARCGSGSYKTLPGDVKAARDSSNRSKASRILNTLDSGSFKALHDKSRIFHTLGSGSFKVLPDESRIFHALGSSSLKELLPRAWPYKI